MAISLDDIEVSDPIYVYNRAGRKIGKQCSPYVLEVRDRNGRSYPVTIPATKYPFLLSGQIPTKVLRESMEFRNACRRNGPLELVAPDKAKAIMQDPLAQKTVDAAMERFERRFENKNKLNIAVQEGQVHKSNTPPPQAQHNAKVTMINDQAVVEMTAAKQDIDPRVVQIVLDLKSNPDLRDEKFYELNAMDESELTDNDLGYLLTQCRDAPKIYSWARNEMARRASSQEPQDIEEDVANESDASVEQTDAVEVRQRKRRRR